MVGDKKKKKNNKPESYSDKAKKTGMYDPISNASVNQSYIVGKNYTVSEGGKKVRRKYLGETDSGAKAWQGVTSPKMRKTKSAPAFDSKKRKTSKRKYGKYI